MVVKLLIDRKWKCSGYTISNLFVNGVKFCDVLEDTDRGLSSGMSVDEIVRIKKYGETAIPSGRYKVVLNMSNRFKRILPEILNVKGYSGVRIHRGNTVKDTLGCPLVGENKVKGQVINSRIWEERLMSVLRSASDIELEIW